MYEMEGPRSARCRHAGPVGGPTSPASRDDARSGSRAARPPSGGNALLNPDLHRPTGSRGPAPRHRHRQQGLPHWNGPSVSRPVRPWSGAPRQRVSPLPPVRLSVRRASTMEPLRCRAQGAPRRSVRWGARLRCGRWGRPVDTPPSPGRHLRRTRPARASPTPHGCGRPPSTTCGRAAETERASVSASGRAKPGRRAQTADGAGPVSRTRPIGGCASGVWRLD